MPFILFKRLIFWLFLQCFVSFVDVCANNITSPFVVSTTITIFINYIFLKMSFFNLYCLKKCSIFLFEIMDNLNNLTILPAKSRHSSKKSTVVFNFLRLPTHDLMTMYSVHSVDLLSHFTKVKCDSWT